MAWEQPGQIVSLPCVTTGIGQYKFVNISTAGNVIRTVRDGAAIGVSQTGTTGSTIDPTGISVMVSGISKVKFSTASTVGVGQVVAASSLGSPVPAVAASFVVGQIVAGSSGGAGRVVSVLIAGPGASTALV